MEIMYDIELSFSLEEMKAIIRASELNELTPTEYIRNVIESAYCKDSELVSKEVIQSDN